MRRWLALSAIVFLATIGWLALRDIRRGYRSARGAHVVRFTLHSRLLHRKLDEVLVTPRGGGEGRPLLVFLHGRSSPPDSNLSDPFFKGLRDLGNRAPNVLFATAAITATSTTARAEPGAPTSCARRSRLQSRARAPIRDVSRSAASR